MAEGRAPGLAVVAHPDAEPGTRGTATLDAVAGLLAHGWRVVLTAPGDGPLLASARLMGAETAIASAAGAPLLLRRLGPDAVHVRSASMPAWVVAARLLRMPVVALVEGPVLASGSLAISSIATRVLVHSEHDRTAAIAAAGRCAGRTTVVAAPVTPPVALVPARVHLEGPVRLLHLAAGADVAVEALAVLVDAGVEARLRCGGPDQVHTSVLRRISALGLDGLVIFEHSQRDPWAAMADADIVLLTSRDGRPVDKAVQAVLAGRPVIVDDVGARAESVDWYASAIPVPPGDPTRLASAVRRIAANWSAFRRTALAMASIAAERHSAERYGAGIDLVMRGATRSMAAVRPASSLALAAVGRDASEAGRLELDGRPDRG